MRSARTYGTIAMQTMDGFRGAFGNREARRAMAGYTALALAMCFALGLVYERAATPRSHLPVVQETALQFNGNKIYRAGALFTEMTCRLDDRINANNIQSYTENLGQIWGSACGLNRGIFTLVDYPGETFNCGKLPTDWGAPNGVADFFTPGRDMEKDLKSLGMYIGGVFNTTAGIGPATCSFNGVAHLWCGNSRYEPWRRTPWVSLLGNKPIRGVNIGGLFVLEPWINRGFTKWGDEIRDQSTYCRSPNMTAAAKQKDLQDHWDKFYTEEDFKMMASLGLNVARLPVGWWYFAAATNLDPSPYYTPSNNIMTDLGHPITRVIQWAAKYGVHIILDLHGAPGGQNGLDNSGIRSMDPVAERWGDGWFYGEQYRVQTVNILKTMTTYINMLSSNGISNILMLELMNEPWVFGDMSVVRDFYVEAISEVRKINSSLPILVCDAFRHEEWHWLLRRKGFSFENVYMDTHLYHAFNPSDVASDNLHDDMMKQITASNMACGYGSLLRYKTCSSLPTLTGEWSLAIDDCMGFLTGSTSSANQFQDFGQCKNLQSRNNAQWTQLVTDFAARQRTVFERELGWVFWTWKVDDVAIKDISAKYWSYKEAVKYGFFPKDLRTEQGLMKRCDHDVDLSTVVLPAPPP